MVILGEDRTWMDVRLSAGDLGFWRGEGHVRGEAAMVPWWVRGAESAELVSPRSLRVMKRQLWEAQFQTLAEATVKANHEMELSFAADDFKEGVAAFLAKRPANFQGR